MGDALLPPPVLEESTISGENGSSSSVVQDGEDIKFHPPVKMEFGETEFISQGVGTMSASDECLESDPLELTPSDLKCHEAKLKRSSSFAVQGNIDIKFQPRVKMERIKTEIISPTVGSVSAPEECSESDQLEWTPSEATCQEEHVPGSPSSPDFIWVSKTDLDKKSKPVRSSSESPLFFADEYVEELDIDVQSPNKTKQAPTATQAGPSSSDVGATARCLHCDFKCLEQHRLDKHMQNCHERRHKCGICGKAFSDVSGLARHHRIHTGQKPYECDVCGKAFGQRSHLTGHYRIHTGQRPYECDVCGKSFVRRSHLTGHHRLHNGQRPYECDVCGKAFGYSSHLTDHYHVHTGQRPYECDVCGKTFAHRSHLADHHRIYTGQKLYECDVCGKAFVQMSYLTDHHRVHTGQKPFECDVCGKAFGHRSNLTTHYCLHTGQRP